MKKPPEPGQPRPFVPPPFASTTLASGLAVRAARWGKRPTVAVSLLFPGAGSAADPDGREGTAEIAAYHDVCLNHGFATKDDMLGSKNTRETRDFVSGVLG